VIGVFRPSISTWNACGEETRGLTGPLC